MNITLNTPKEIVVIAEKVKIINQITINRMVDMPSQKKSISFNKRNRSSYVMGRCGI